MKWEKVRLKDICESIADGDHQPPPKSINGIPFVTIANITDNKIDFSKSMFVSNDYYENLDQKRRAQKDDILYSVVGTFGIPVFIKEYKPFVFQRHIAILRPNKNNIDAKFLYYMMLSKNFYMKADSVAIGAAQRTITLNSLRNIEVDVPKIETQRRIADILSTYDDLIENNQKQIKLLEEAAQRLYKEWFVDLHFPGCEQTKLIDGVPEGWKNNILSDIADISMGQSPKSEFYNDKKDGLPFHQGVGSYGNRFVIDNVYTTSYTRIAEPDSILFSVRAPVGRLNRTKNRIVIGRGLSAINHKKGCQGYLFYLLKNKFFKDNILGNGSIFASISKDELANQKLIIPTDSLVERFNSQVKSIDDKIDILDSQNELLKETRDRLLPKLMSGEIEV